MANRILEIEEAKSYIKSRLVAENNATSRLRELMLAAAKEIIKISLEYNIPPRLFRFSSNKELGEKVDKVISDLRKRIEDYTLYYSLGCLGSSYDDDDREALEEYFYSEQFGSTFVKRNNQYCYRYKYEIEAMIAAGMSKDMDADEIYDAIDLKNPYTNELFLSAVKDGNLSATRITTEGISYGVGKATAAFNALETLVGYSVASTWMYNSFAAASANGAIGFMTFRNSSYDCSICDDYSHVVHDMSERFPPLHPHCVCGMLFIYNK